MVVTEGAYNHFTSGQANVDYNRVRPHVTIKDIESSCDSPYKVHQATCINIIFKIRCATLCK